MRSRRASGAVVANGFSSLGNLTLTIGIARTTDLDGVGIYGLAFAMYMLLTGIVRSGVTESVLGAPPSAQSNANGLHRVSLLGILTALLALIVFAVSGSLYIAIMAGTIHGLLVLDYFKILSMSLGRPSRALCQELTWTAASISGVVLGIAVGFDATTMFLIWAASGCLIGYGRALQEKLSIFPCWTGGPDEAKKAALYSLDFLAGSGTAHISFALLAAVAGTGAAGTIRGAATLISPANLVTSTARSLAIPYLVRSQRAPVGELRMARVMTLIMALAVSPLLALAVLLPSGWGKELLGASWPSAQTVLLPLAIESLLTVATTVAFAGHRAHDAAKRTLLVRIVLAPVRIVVVLCAGAVAGAYGAAWAMVGMGLIGLAVWWHSYYALTKNASRDNG